MVRRRGVGRGDLQQQRLVEGPADDVHAYRQLRWDGAGEADVVVAFIRNKVFVVNMPCALPASSTAGSGRGFGLSLRLVVFFMVFILNFVMSTITRVWKTFFPQCLEIF